MYEYLFHTYGVLQDVQEDVQIISCLNILVTTKSLTQLLHNHMEKFHLQELPIRLV